MERERIDHIALLDAYRPFPAAVNPHATVVHDQTVVWARHFRLVPISRGAATLDATKLGYLAARFHPEAPRATLQLISDWYAWMFLRDDQRDESELGTSPAQLAAEDARLLAVLKGAAPPPDAVPLMHALSDLTQRLSTMVTPRLWLRRFILAVKAHFDATLWEATNRSQQVTPDLTTYMRMRPLTGGMDVDAAFIDLAEGAYLPAEVRNQVIVQRLTVASNNAVCWANDILSLPKELRSGDVHNLVLILHHHSELPLSDALAQATRLHDAEVQTFMNLLTDLPVFGTLVDANLKHYVKALMARMRGNIDWSLASERYREPTLTTWKPSKQNG